MGDHRLDLDETDLAPIVRLVVGDSVWDMQAAVRVGAHGIGVATGGTSAPELLEAGAELTFPHLTALLEALQRGRPAPEFGDWGQSWHADQDSAGSTSAP